MLTGATRLEVWGDPVSHSLSPRLHAAAYTRLGWDWSYDRRRVDLAGFAAALDGLDPRFRGLSLTFPLKAAAYEAATTRDRPAELTGAVNTLVLGGDDPRGGARRGFNTDVGGMAADLRDHGIAAVDRARIVGAGATATSALVALRELGADRVDVVARRPDAAAGLARLGAHLGLRVEVTAPDAVAPASVPLTVSTLPGGASLDVATTDALVGGGGLLYDVVYGHWPTVLADAWQRAGGRAVDGRGMLLRQAVLQIRAFATGEVTEPLPDEEDVVAVMRAALMGD